MSFHDRYINGEDGRSVYNEIYNLGQQAFDDDHFVDIQNVLTETFSRVNSNLDIILAELRQINYAFKTEFKYNFERPVLKPLSNTNDLLLKLENIVKDFGQIPYSLKLFYKIVGACNFGWDYNNRPEILWEGADPIQICSLDDIVSEVSSDDWREYTYELIEQDESHPPCLELAPDYLHKDNVSGGLPYAIQLTKESCIDSLFLNESHATTFIDYLRICMENCGFSRITEFSHDDDYQNFFEKVRPQLKMI